MRINKFTLAALITLLIAGPAGAVGVIIQVPRQFDTQSSPWQEFISAHPRFANSLQRRRPNAIIGTVAEFDPAANAMVIQRDNRYWGVVGANSSVYRSGRTTISPADIRPGDRVLAFGQPAANQPYLQAVLIKKLP